MSQDETKNAGTKTLPNAQKVLIAEDEKPLAKALEVKLNKSGINAKAVFNGLEAMSALDQSQYDLLLLDIMMPTVDGWAVLKKIHEGGKGPKVVITSNLSQQEDVQRAKDLGATDFWVKSNTTLADIVEKIKLLLK